MIYNCPYCLNTLHSYSTLKSHVSKSHGLALPASKEIFEQLNLTNPFRPPKTKVTLDIVFPNFSKFYIKNGNYLAMNADGIWYEYPEIPIISSNSWIANPCQIDVHYSLGKLECTNVKWSDSLLINGQDGLVKA